MEKHELRNTCWQLKEFREQDVVTPVILGTRLTSYFDVRHSLSGSGGCNTYGGGYGLKLPSHINISDLFSTKIFCQTPDGVMEQESRFFRSLTAASVFKIENDHLYLSWADGGKALIFESTEMGALDA